MRSSNPSMSTAVLVCCIAACGRSSNETPQPPRETTSVAPARVPPTPTPPPRKAFVPTPQASFGTLPENVGVPVGGQMPNATVEDSRGKSVQLSSIRSGYSGRWMLIAFYRGGWCPFCNFEIHDLTQSYPEFEKRGALPVAISVDRPEKAAETTATYQIPFPVLSDPDLHAHEVFKVLYSADSAEIARLKSKGMDVEAASNRTHHRFAIPSLFLVDRDGIVRWAHADADYKTRPTSAQLLAMIDKLNAS